MIKKLFFLGCIAFATNNLSAQAAALSFDGTDDYLSNTSVPVTGSTSRTIEAWIKTTKNSDTGTGGTQSVIVDMGNSTTTWQRFTLNILYGNRLRLEFNGGGVNCDQATTQPLNDGNWHHVAVVWDATKTGAARVQFYIDGVAAANLSTSTLTGTPNTPTTGVFRIGNRVDNANYFQGSIDDVRVWNYARTAAQIAADMNVEYCNPSAQTGLVRYYTFNNGVPSGINTAVSTVYDYSTNAKNVTTTNMELTGSASNYVSGVPSVMMNSSVDNTVLQNFQFLTANQASATSYQWYDCTTNTPISGATSQSFTAPAVGNYSVMVNIGGCTSMSNCVTVSTLGVKDVEFQNALQVYPNPSQGEFNVSLGKTNKETKIQVFDASGKLLKKQTFKNSSDINFNLDAPKGTYFLQIIDENGKVANEKISKK